ncbi:MAG: transglutaminase domain-containing protein, partial [Micromonosporaceae bacterium]|nr:transglutaminase domain-containing protein [Micromonosporaceae bacterium]
MVALKYGAREVTLKQGTGSPVVPLALVGMLSACGLMLSRIYAGPLLLRLMVGAAVLVVAISLAMRRLPAWSTAPVSVAGLAGYTLLSVRLSAAASDLPGTIGELTRDAAYNGIPRLLTAMIPIEPQPDTVVIPVVSVWIAGLASAELALRGRRVLLSYLPIALLLAGCLYVVGPNATPAPVPAMIFVACAAFGLAGSVDGDRAARQDLPGADRRAIRLRVAAGAATGLVAVLAAGMALGPVAAGLVSHSPTDPRRYVAPPHLDSLDESPLARLSGWALEPSQHLFDVTAPGGPHRIRLAVLSDFDGVTWRVGGNYQTAGRILSGPPSQVDPGAAAGESVEQSIVIDQLDGRLVPAITTPERIEGVRIAYDPEIATMALPEGLRPGLAYTVVSRKPVVNAEVLAAATTPQDEETVRRLTKLQGDVPPDIERLASQLAEGADSPYQRALAIEQFIAEHYQQVADAPSGHAYPNLSFFLFTARNAGGQKGTSEQFAASFAVLGRALGLATRVAVGFDVP